MNYSDELVETLNKMKYFMSTVKSEIEHINSRKQIIEMQLVDIEHLVQIGQLDGKGLLKCAKKLKDLREEREELKREYNIIKGLNTMISAEKNVVRNQITQLANNTKNIKESQAVREYHVRSLDKEFVLSVIKNEDVLKTINF